MILRALLASALLAGTAAPAQNPPAPPEARHGATLTGQKLKVPKGRLELVTSVRVLPSGGRIPMHRHRWQRYVYVESGRIQVVVPETGLVREFGAGDVVTEPLGQWHEGQAIGDAPVRLVVFDQVPPGASNMELKEPL